MTATAHPQRLGLLKGLRDLARSGARVDASILTSYAFNGLFYEEVLLRAFQRAGSRLNIVLMDAAQLAETMADPLRRPTRAGKDYLLVPVTTPGAFHPKIVALLSESHPFLAIGSHNATDSGYTHNEEVTAWWGPGKTPSVGVLRAATEYCLEWLRASDALSAPILQMVNERLAALMPKTEAAANEELAFIASRPGAPLWDQFRAHVSAPVTRAVVVGPYFDAGLSLLHKIAEEFRPAEIIVGVQPDTVLLTTPQAAPANTRFVDSASIQAFASKQDDLGFVHGKALVLETARGMVVTLGSANPTGAGWLDTEWSNPEANLCLTGEAAAEAFAALGLGGLINAAALHDAALHEIADRSLAVRRAEEEARKEKQAVPIISARMGDAGVILPGFVVWPSPDVTLRGAGLQYAGVLSSVDAGALCRLELPARPGGGLYALETAGQLLAYVILNDQQAVRAATLPRAGGRLLDRLGSLGSGTGFDELFDLIDRHIVSPPDAGASAAPSSSPQGAVPGGTDDGDAPFGPRGISMPTALGREDRPRLIADGLISEVIATLIRLLGAKPAPVTDGDAPNLDEEDADAGEATADTLAANIEHETAGDVDWPQLVTVCRRRLSIVIRRLDHAMAESGAVEPAWALGRLLVALFLLKLLRSMPPIAKGPLAGRTRPDSLVTLEQLRQAFGVAMKTMYGVGALALRLESPADTRATEERRLLDNLLLWFAREVGADLDRDASVRESDKDVAVRLQGRADLVILAMSAAAYPELEPWVEHRDPWLAIWSDSITPSEAWAMRHRVLGDLLGQAPADRLAAPPRPVRTGDLVQWLGEKGLPRVVKSVAGAKVELIEPATGGQPATKRVMLSSLTLIDLGAASAEPPGARRTA